MKLQTKRKSALSVTVLTLLGIVAVLGGFLLSRIETAPDDSAAAAGETFTICSENSGGCDFLFGEGLQQAINSTKDGDIIVIKPGTYTLSQPQVMTSSDGQMYNCFAYVQNKAITIRGEGGAVLDGSTSLEGLNGICVDNGALVVANLELKYFRPNNSRTIIAEGNAIQVANGSLQGQALLINNNEGSGVTLEKSPDSSLRHSIINGNNRNGLQSSDSVTLAITNNTIVNNGMLGILLTGLTSANVVNNISHNNGRLTDGKNPTGIVAEKSANFIQLDANLSSNNTGGDYNSNELPVNNYDQTSHICRPIPGFKSPGSTEPPFTLNDFHLIDNGNGACDKAFAIDQGLASIEDPDGTRSDIGAYGGTASCSIDPNLPGCSSTCACLGGVVISDLCRPPESGVCVDDSTCSCSINSTPTPTSPPSGILTCEQGFSDNFSTGIDKWNFHFDNGASLDIKNEELVFIVEDLMPRIYRHVEIESKQSITGEFLHKVEVVAISPDSNESGSALLAFLLDTGSIVEEEFKIGAGNNDTGDLMIEGTITDDYSVTIPATDPPVSGSLVDLYIERTIRPGVVSNVDVNLYYDLGSGKQLLGKETLPPIFASDGLLRLRGENTGPEFLAFEAALDNVNMSCPASTIPTPTPTLTSTPTVSTTPSPSVIPSITVTITPTPTVTPTVTTQVYYCGQMDVNNDGIFNIVDLAAFAQGYPNRTCTIQTVGPTVVQPRCSFVDMNRDGRVNIADFASFAQRYYYPGNRVCDL